MEQSDIRQWVEANAKGLMPEIPLSPDEVEHVSMCLEHILKWYHEGYPIGHFLTAVVKNDFSGACIRADDVNRKALYLYALFLANKIPFDYRDKALGKKKGGQDERD